MKIHQYFTGHGIVGILLFVLGNIAMGAVWMLIVDADRTSAGASTSLLIAAGISGFAVLISVPLMLIGRTYDVEIVHIPKDKIS